MMYLIALKEILLIIIFDINMVVKKCTRIFTNTSAFYFQ